VADSLLKSGTVENERLENLYHTVACKAAIKGGNDQLPIELEALAKRVLSNSDIMYCPHGRPVAFQLKRSELERQFGRTK
ncbi:MAG: DNA mismatch repair protein MutL, partial [Clostridia bacterium]|nr:DNA mismatch repair protein MutL [Clostridia bacterium]